MAASSYRMRSSVFSLGAFPSFGVDWVSSPIGVAAAHAASSTFPSMLMDAVRRAACATGRGSFWERVVCCAAADVAKMTTASGGSEPRSFDARVNDMYNLHGQRAGFLAIRR